MQTFLPYPIYLNSARCLDKPRLGKQRSETLTLIRTIVGEHDAWKHHPLIRMWKPYLPSLVEYGIIICDEWVRRGCIDDTKSTILAYAGGEVVTPHWLGNPQLHASHRSNLLRKDYEWYRHFNWTEVGTQLEYYYP